MMSTVTVNAARLLNRPLDEISAILQLKDDAVVEEIEGEVYAEFPNDGVSIILSDNLCKTVFLYSEGYEQYRAFDGILENGISFSCSREDVRKTLGQPPESNIKEGLQEHGYVPMWDRYNYEGFSLHFQYAPRGEDIDLITIMSPEDQ